MTRRRRQFGYLLPLSGALTIPAICVRMNRYVTCMHLWLLRPGKLWPCRMKTWTWMTMTHCCGLPNLHCRISLLEDWNFQSEQPAQRRERCEWSSLQYLPPPSLSATLLKYKKWLLIPGWRCCRRCMGCGLMSKGLRSYTGWKNRSQRTTSTAQWGRRLTQDYVRNEFSWLFMRKSDESRDDLPEKKLCLGKKEFRGARKEKCVGFKVTKQMSGVASFVFLLVSLLVTASFIL